MGECDILYGIAGAVTVGCVCGGRGTVAVLAQEHIGNLVRDEDGLQNLRTTSAQEHGVLHTPAERDLISWLVAAV